MESRLNPRLTSAGVRGCRRMRGMIPEDPLPHEEGQRASLRERQYFWRTDSHNSTEAGSFGLFERAKMNRFQSSENSSRGRKVQGGSPATGSGSYKNTFPQSARSAPRNRCPECAPTG